MIQIIRKDILFYTIFFIKIIFAVVFASYYLNDYFIPFVSYFASNNFADPYSYFLQHNRDIFPYPALMLYILAFFKLTFGWLSYLKLELLIYRLPLLLADITILLILKQWLYKYKQKLLLYYWCSPILFYISYIHGQLDAIPIALLFVSLFYLFKEKNNFSAIFFGLALSTKTHIIILLPFITFYLFSRNNSFKSLLFYIFVSFFIFIITNSPFLNNNSFVEMVLCNKQQLKIYSFYLNILGSNFYIIPAGILFLYFKGALIRFFNKDILLTLLGFSFSVILLFLPPAAGWYYWILPFLCYFYIKESGRSFILFAILQVVYCCYFAFNKAANFDEINATSNLYNLFKLYNIDSNKIENLLYTLLQTTLLINCVWLYNKGIKQYRKLKIISKPLCIGIGGASGVGKTTLSDSLIKCFLPYNTTVIRGDDVHKWERGDNNWKSITHYNPKANNLHKEIPIIKTLKEGKNIKRCIYNHDNGKFLPANIFSKNNIILYEGLHPFYIKKQRELYDIKIFIKPDPVLEKYWKVNRDMTKRRSSKEKVLQQIDFRKEDQDRYINAQESKSDLLIEPNIQGKYKEVSESIIEQNLYYSITLNNSVYVESILSDIHKDYGFDIKHEYINDDKQKIVLKQQKVIKDISLQKLIYKHMPYFEDIGINPINLNSNLYNVLQLLILYYISEECKSE